MATTYRSLSFRSELFELALHRIIGYAPFGGSAIGECLYAASRIDNDDISSWSAAWDDMATRVQEQGEAALADGRLVTARNAFLRAHNYFRAAAVWRVHDDPLHVSSWKASVRCFEEAGRLRRPSLEQIEIPYGSSTLPGYFVRASDDDEPRPTLIAMGGGDASGEESYFHCGGEGPARRGWNVLTFHGPGHRGALHRNPAMRWRHDYEVVISQVVDYVSQRPDVDTERLALYGVSLGGYVVLRSAGSNDRIKAVIANSPVLDFHEVASTPPAAPPKDAPPPEPLPPAVMKYFLDLYQWTYDPDIASRDDFLRCIEGFKAHEFVGKIRCPVLSISSEGEPPSTRPQVELFAQLCRAPLTSRHFTAAEGADAHVQFNNLVLVTDTIFDWLDGVLGT